LSMNILPSNEDSAFNIENSPKFDHGIIPAIAKNAGYEIAT